MVKPKIETFNDLDAVAGRAAELFVHTAKESISEEGVMFVALSGGSTPKKLHQLLSTQFATELKPLWDKVHFFIGDERFVAPEHKDSNYRMAKETLFDHVPVPVENIHPFDTELEDATETAALYEKTMKKVFSASAITDGFPRFDLIFLGLGADGHTASLFPGTKALEETNLWVTANYVEKLKAQRLTFTYPTLNNSKQIVFLVCGEEKADVIKEIIETKAGKYPVEKITPENGQVTWLLDKAAASQLRTN